jgi:hypothetical protein
LFFPIRQSTNTKTSKAIFQTNADGWLKYMSKQAWRWVDSFPTGATLHYELAESKVRHSQHLESSQTNPNIVIHGRKPKIGTEFPP